MAGERLLLVDDEDNLRTMLDAALRHNGFEITAVATGRAALEAVATSEPDLVLLDVMLPRRDGFEVCQKLREDGWDDLKIVMLTAKGRDVEIEKGLAVGADAYVTKPFSTGDLVARVARLLEPGA
jgi:two-component system, OmpR family, alkaline phosphatase synthesis response regulator PhoP